MLLRSAITEVKWNHSVSQKKVQKHECSVRNPSKRTNLGTKTEDRDPKIWVFRETTNQGALGWFKQTSNQAQTPVPSLTKEDDFVFQEAFLVSYFQPKGRADISGQSLTRMFNQLTGTSLLGGLPQVWEPRLPLSLLQGLKGGLESADLVLQRPHVCRFERTDLPKQNEFHQALPPSPLQLLCFAFALGHKIQRI